MEFKVSMVRLRPQLMIPPPPESIVPPQGGTETVFGSFLSLGGSVWADSFCNESEISCIKFIHHTKGIPAEKMFDPHFMGGQTLFSGVFSGVGVQIRLIPFAMSQKSLADRLDTPQRVWGKNLSSKKKVSRFMFLLFLS